MTGALSSFRFTPTRKWTWLALLLSAFFVLYTLSSSSYSASLPQLNYPWSTTAAESLQVCSPEAYVSGHWAKRPTASNATRMSKPQDALAFSGFEGCASSREYNWHLASDKEEQYDRFPSAQSWEWIPGEECHGVGRLDKEKLVRDLIEDGGWYLVGDSVTENHFFSLSCILYPHVIATPDYTSGGSWDRGWPQNLYLSPSSPLVDKISFPKNFNISTTALVTFRRIDLLFSQDQLVEIHKELHAAKPTPLADDSLFSDEATWTLPIEEYLAEFFAPSANYATMVVSTAGHWTTTLFSKVSPEGIDGVITLFEFAMKRWADIVQAALTKDQRALLKENPKWPASAPGRPPKRAVIRAYLPGHESCHDFRAAWAEVQPFQWNWYNWGEISRYNKIFETLLDPKASKYPNIHYLGIDRPARLRPDAHTTGDCLHIMTGAGVLEGWTHYIWHYVTHLPYRQ
ncbi:hypothetical protein D9619_011535 [Psilocybe cf. subviscida]|uniref:Uncharacterized protein n=1 Tax=Psilocybe cf. subviscida TaxID=2480587 RepID=A0A8H5FA02_9AGAR|nr:hypothetical protein D9619_011535 [Psilocybe cf. subviscida]